MIYHFDRLVESVQTNCHIADARHAGDLTLCTYLLEMREFYRWEQGIAFSQQPLRAEVGKWLSAREALWLSLESSDFLALPVEDRQFEPFAVGEINEVLAPHGLVYGAGVGVFGKPQFFLGKLEREECRGGARILVAGCEYARDLAAAPAGLRDSTIFLRQESLRRWLWEKFESWAIKKSDGALKATLEAYGFDRDPYSALERMTNAESETLVLHELGELEVGKLLGEEWSTMRASFTGRRAELLARAVRDNLADCLVTLPTLLEREAATSIHFWFSNFDGMRRELFPRMASAYTAWRAGDRMRAVGTAVFAGREHWHAVCERLLALHRSWGAEAEVHIESLIVTPGTCL